MFQETSYLCCQTKLPATEWKQLALSSMKEMNHSSIDSKFTLYQSHGMVNNFAIFQFQ